MSANKTTPPPLVDPRKQQAENFRKTQYTPDLVIPLYKLNRHPNQVGVKIEEMQRAEENEDGTFSGRLARCYNTEIKIPEDLERDATLELKKEITGGVRETVTQVWRAVITHQNDSRQQDVVAKFFDPLFHYDLTDVNDAFMMAIREFWSEYDCYKHLAHLRVSVVPTCIGPYLSRFDPIFETTHARSVYVLITEVVAGTTLDAMNPHSLHSDGRGRIFYNAFKLKRMLEACGVQQYDFLPRNLVLPQPTEPTVAMFDLGSPELIKVIARSRGGSDSDEFSSGEAARTSELQDRSSPWAPWMN